MPYHRGWAWAIGKGMKPHILLAELLGKKTGYNRGKGGPHLGCYELEFWVGRESRRRTCRLRRASG